MGRTASYEKSAVLSRALARRVEKTLPSRGVRQALRDHPQRLQPQDERGHEQRTRRHQEALTSDSRSHFMCTKSALIRPGSASDASCERLVTAVAMEISEEWVTGRTNLDISEANDAHPLAGERKLQKGVSFSLATPSALRGHHELRSIFLQRAPVNPHPEFKQGGSRRDRRLGRGGGWHHRAPHFRAKRHGHDRKDCRAGTGRTAPPRSVQRTRAAAAATEVASASS